ncbi:MAG: nucleotidyl transferase AbiEii/AbiGii toxin family protein [Solirubrobacterales bacterium]
MPTLPERVIAVDLALSEANISHAFGGALALAYYAEPRSTLDIDVNVFVRPRAADQVEAALSPLGVEAVGDREALIRDGQARWRWDQTPVDLFFSNDPIHEAMAEMARRVPFGGTTIPIIAGEHLLICKVAFDRPKDWIDIEQMLLMSEGLNRVEVERWLERLLGEDDPRRERLESLLNRQENRD